MNTLLRSCVLGSVIVGASLESDAPGDPPRPLIEYRNAATYQIKHRITFTNHDVTTMTSLELNLPVPTDWAEQSIVLFKNIGHQPFQLKDERTPNRIIRSFDTRSLPGPGERTVLENDFQLVSREIRTDKKTLATMYYPRYDTRTRDYRLYTRSEKLLEADDPAIVEIASRLKFEANGPYHFAKAAYDFTIEHIAYATPSPAWGACAVLKEGKGDCGQYAALFVAICRAGGVPARPVAGCWATGVNQWHCWAEFLLPSVGWIPVDPTVGQRGPRERAYYFGNLDNNRLALVKGYNMSFRTERGSRTHGFLQPGTYFWYYGPGSPGSRVTCEIELRGVKLDESQSRGQRADIPKR